MPLEQVAAALGCTTATARVRLHRARRRLRAVAIAMKVSAKSQDFMAAFIEQTTTGAVPAGETSGGCGCG